MKNRVKTFSVLLAVLCAAHIWPPLRLPVATEGAELPTVKVAMSDDQSIISERILYEALKRSGYQMVASVSGMGTAIRDVMSGDSTVLPLQTPNPTAWAPGNEDKFQVVNVPIDRVEFTVYTRGGELHRLDALPDIAKGESRWTVLTDLRLGYRPQNVFVANNIHKAGAAETREYPTAEMLWSSLLNGETDAVILPRISHFEHRYPRGVKRAVVIETQDVYTYVSKAYPGYTQLVEKLEQAYTAMLSEGRIADIHSGITDDGKHIVSHISF